MANSSTPEALFDEARKVLHIAAKYDAEKQYGQAVDNYIIGISLLMKYLDNMKSKPLEASKLEKQIDSYMRRAEDLKKLIKKPIVVESAHQRIIEEDSVGHSYENIFKGLLNEKITFVRIEEPLDDYVIVKMGRGLDIYKKVDQFSLGACDFNMRPCRSCKIEIMRTTPATK
uniref:MIT domain-containing protein n=1 Tax=Panagrolaimus superbus TaxID=310955 RepID=A0A914ZFT2_9BILA